MENSGKNQGSLKIGTSKVPPVKKKKTSIVGKISKVLQNVFSLQIALVSIEIKKLINHILGSLILIFLFLIICFGFYILVNGVFVAILNRWAGLDIVYSLLIVAGVNLLAGLIMLRVLTFKRNIPYFTTIWEFVKKTASQMRSS